MRQAFAAIRILIPGGVADAADEDEIPLVDRELTGAGAPASRAIRTEEADSHGVAGSDRPDCCRDHHRECRCRGVVCGRGAEAQRGKRYSTKLTAEPVTSDTADVD